MKKGPTTKSDEAKSSSGRQTNQTNSVPPRTSLKKQIFMPLAVLVFLLVGTTLAILYARGYRFFFQQGEPQLSKTGILHVTSNPNGAQVFIDDRPNPTTSTDNSLNLAPKKYKVKIAKEGYNDWIKDVDIQAEVVTNVDARLLPKAPTLQSISTFGIEEALIDPTGTKIAFKIASQSATRNGIYIFDMTRRSLPILQGQSSSTQLANDTTDKFSQAQLSFSPDGKQLLASIAAAVDPEVSPTPNLEIVPPDAEAPAPEEASSQLSNYYLLEVGGFNENPQDITATSINVLETWRNQRNQKERTRTQRLKPKVAEFARKNFRILSWSPDERKILYQASASAEMPVFVNPRRIGNNWRYEKRNLEKGAIYVYNITEDLNTRIVEPVKDICPRDGAICEDSESTMPNPFSWFPDSAHLIYLNDKKISIVENDGSNMTTVYAGPFLGDYVFPWPDGSKIVILTNLGNPSVAPTLYTIGLK